MAICDQYSSKDNCLEFMMNFLYQGHTHWGSVSAIFLCLKTSKRIKTRWGRITRLVFFLYCCPPVSAQPAVLLFGPAVNPACSGGAAAEKTIRDWRGFHQEFGLVGSMGWCPNGWSYPVLVPIQILCSSRTRGPAHPMGHVWNLKHFEATHATRYKRIVGGGLWKQPKFAQSCDRIAKMSDFLKKMEKMIPHENAKVAKKTEKVVKKSNTKPYVSHSAFFSKFRTLVACHSRNIGLSGLLVGC